MARLTRRTFTAERHHAMAPIRLVHFSDIPANVREMLEKPPG
jgi:hypothetical protein